MEYKPTPTERVDRYGMRRNIGGEDIVVLPEGTLPYFPELNGSDGLRDFMGQVGRKVAVYRDRFSITIFSPDGPAQITTHSKFIRPLGFIEQFEFETALRNKIASLA